MSACLLRPTRRECAPGSEFPGSALQAGPRPVSHAVAPHCIATSLIASRRTAPHRHGTAEAPTTILSATACSRFTPADTLLLARTTDPLNSADLYYATVAHHEKKKSRPTMQDLFNANPTASFSGHSPRARRGSAGLTQTKGARSKADDGKTKFGMFEGVFARCLLNIWGVIMFLRMGWMVGQAGAWEATSIVVVAMTVTIITTLSLSAICTNGTVKSGGAYYLISRTLGPQFGGAIGILFR